MDLIFLDLETTGTDPDKDRIIEIGALIVSDELNVIDSFQSPVYCSADILDNMDDWCKETHSNSGLVQLVYYAPSSTVVESRFIEWLKAHEVQHKAGKLAGYSVQTDRAFIKKRMKTLDEFLSHRIIDVSTIRDLARRWSLVDVPHQNMPHRALEDCYVALEELRYYKKFI